MVVEDDEVISRAIQAALSERGYETYVASTVADGMDLVSRRPVGLLVLDIGLPDGSGWDLLDGLRGRALHGGVAVVVISSALVTRAELRQRGVDRFIPKPFDMAYLVSTVDELLGRPAPGGPSP